MVAKRKKKLRSGYTTGACAAAAAKAAAQLLLTDDQADRIEIPFPDGSRVWFVVHSCQAENGRVRASIIKDAGDDPDVTNGAEIVAYVRMVVDVAGETNEPITILGGDGVGTITKRGLAVKVGEPAINPVPRQMIREAVTEALVGAESHQQLEVTISVIDGEKLAEKTLNYRLGIVGGLSILGTTGIVRPVSAEAWTATIKASMDVARAAGLDEVVLSTGRTSERAVQNRLALAEEAYAMMGDYLGFSLEEAKLAGFKKIHLAGMWAKIMKAALETPQTHVRHGALEVAACLELLGRLGADKDLLSLLTDANTAREIYERLNDQKRLDLVERVCRKAKEYAEKVSGLPVTIYLVTSNTKVVMCV